MARLPASASPWLAFLLGAAWAVPGCVTDLPQAPGWPTTLGIPIIDDTTTIGRIARRRIEFLEVDPGRRLIVDFTTRFGPGGRGTVGERMRLQPRGGMGRFTLGPIALPDRQVPPLSVTLAQLLGREPGAAPGLPVASFATRLPLALEGVEQVQVRSGSLLISVRNGLAVPIASLRVALADTGSEGASIGTAAFGFLEALTGQDSVALDLRSRQLSGRLALVVDGRTAAGDGLVDDGGTLRLGVALRDVLAERFTGMAGEQPVSRSAALELPVDTVQVQRATVLRGGIRVVVRNHLPVAADLEVTMPHATDGRGRPASVVLPDLAPGGGREEVLRLDGLELAPPDPRRLEFLQRGRLHASAASVTLTAEDSISVGLEPLEPLVLRRLEGVVDRLEIPVPPAETVVDFPPGLDNLEFREAHLRTFLQLAVGAKCQLRLGVLGSNRSGEAVQLTVLAELGRGDPAAPVAVEVRPESADFTRFLNLLPTRVVFTPTVLIGDGQGVEVIAADHWVQVDSIEVTSGSWFRIRGPTRIENEPAARRVSGEVRDMIRDGFQAGRLETIVESGMPLQVRVRIMVARQRQEVYRHPDLVIPREGGFEVAPVAIEASGHLGPPLTTQRRDELTRDEMMLLASEGGVYTGVLLELEPTAGEIELHESYYVTVACRGWADIEVNGSKR
ncbi:MAG: hypothetical protein ABIL09_24815 [Gemmatimonadota bacterium]